MQRDSEPDARLFAFEARRMFGVHVEKARGAKPAGPVCGALLFHAEVLYPQPPDECHQPAVTSAVVVRKALLPDIPADRQDLDAIGPVNQVSQRSDRQPRDGLPALHV